MTTPSHILVNAWRPRNSWSIYFVWSGVVTQRSPCSKSIEIGCSMYHITIDDITKQLDDIVAL